MASESRVRANARVELMVEVRCSVWGPDATIQNVIDQAGREAVEKLEILLQKAHHVRLIGEPRVRCVITEGDDGE